jgi:hypothetical protein
VSAPRFNRMKYLEVENANLKRMHINLALENNAINDVLNKTL